MRKPWRTQVILIRSVKVLYKLRKTPRFSGIPVPPKLRYHGRWILTKNGKKIFFAVQIEKTEINNLQRKKEKKVFYFSR